MPDDARRLKRGDFSTRLGVDSRCIDSRYKDLFRYREKKRSVSAVTNSIGTRLGITAIVTVIDIVVVSIVAVVVAPIAIVESWFARSRNAFRLCSTDEADAFGARRNEKLDINGTAKIRAHFGRVATRASLQ